MKDNKFRAGLIYGMLLGFSISTLLVFLFTCII